MAEYKHLTPPTEGSKITLSPEGKPIVPDDPIIPFIEGDGIGPDIWAATQKTVDAAVAKAYGGKRKIVWFETLVGEKAFEQTGEWLPEDALTAIKEYVVAIKGPLTTPVGGGIRSLNVALRQILDLYACVRPVRYFKGVPSPVKNPEKLNVVIYRENTEDVYSGIEWESGTKEVKMLIDFLREKLGVTKIRPDAGVGIKPISFTGTERLVKRAINYAFESGRKSVTLVHKGNIMKFTEGAFKDWGYKVCHDFDPERTVSEEKLWSDYNGKLPEGHVLVKDRIADAMFQQVLLRADEYEVIATPNLNGDYLSDACAAQVGGLGLAPGANIGKDAALFEATHGTAPKYAGQDKVNPGSLMLSAEMMLDHMGWKEAADLIIKGIEGAIANKTVTYDLERQMEGAKLLKCSEFGQAIIDNM